MGYIKLHKNEVCKFARYITYRFGGIADFFTQQIAGNEWNEVAEEFYVLRKTKLSFYQFDHEV